jgi:MoaA/NifB/PqqE/SkfB family radical SAM enzyme
MDRVKRELLNTEWEQILQKSWDAGVPHVIFTGGEPTLRPDLADLITYSENLGQVTGLLTDGYRLCDPEYLHQLLNAGLDHLMILLDPREDQSWEAVLDSLKEDIFVTVHLTITTPSEEDYIPVIDRLAKMGTTSLSLTESATRFTPTLKKCAEYATGKGTKLVWDIPVPYSPCTPVSTEMEDETIIDGAGKAWLYVEPDGDVLPAQGINKPLGNFLLNDWDTIWNNPLRNSPD